MELQVLDMRSMLPEAMQCQPKWLVQERDRVVIKLQMMGSRNEASPRPELPVDFACAREHISPVHDDMSLFCLAPSHQVFEDVSCGFGDEGSGNCKLSQIPAAMQEIIMRLL